jgi:hypothetical protein
MNGNALIVFCKFVIINSEIIKIFKNKLKNPKPYSWSGYMGKTLLNIENKIFDDFGKLSRKSKKEVADFIAFLKAKEEIKATKEIMSDSDFLKSIIKGDEDFAKGRFKKWSEVKENV